MAEQERPTYYKIVRENGRPLYLGGKDVTYEVGKTVTLSDKEFDPQPNCGKGLHFGSLESCMRYGMTWVATNRSDFNSVVALAAVPWRVETKVFEVNPVGRVVRVGDKFKTDKLQITREVPAEEYLPQLLTSKSDVTRPFAVVLLSRMSEELQMQLAGLLNPNDAYTNWLPRWDYLRPQITRFVGTRVRSSKEDIESQKRSGRVSRRKVTPIEGTITDIDPDTMLTTVRGKHGTVIGLQWLQPQS